MLIHTIRDSFIKIRGAVTSADSLMGNSDKDWASRSTTIGVPVPLGANGISVILMGDVENAQATLNAYRYKQNGPALWVAGVTYDIGAQEVGAVDPTGTDLDVSSMKYADTLIFVDQGLPASKCWRQDYEANDGVSELCFDGQGTAYIVIEVSAIDDGLTVIPVFSYW